jgi:ubiquinone/menaquinone biosynthesis C-methylase UbiE
MIGRNIHAMIRDLDRHYPQLADRVDPERAERLQAHANAAAHRDDFGTADHGGRGESYLEAQEATAARARGIDQLLELFCRHGTAESDVVLDLLGGDGLIHRVRSHLGRTTPLVLTCDASPFMVRAAWARGIPAVLQRAEASVFRDDSVGGVLLAYGTHHIPTSLRGTAVRESHRVLQPGGVLVLHDFPSGSPVDTWFTKVVDPYSATGHAFSHFDDDTTRSYLESANFEDVTVTTMNDPIVVQGRSREHAESQLGRYLVNMYGLVHLVEESGPESAYRRAYELAYDIFRYPQRSHAAPEIQTVCDERTATWSATMPREALIAHGRKARDA